MTRCLDAEDDRIRSIVLAEIKALENQIVGLRMALDTLNEFAETLGDAPEPNRRHERRERHILGTKGLLFALLDESGADGLNARLAVEMATKRGRELRRDSASSMLSRLKADGVVSYDGARYRLVQWKP